MSNILRQYKNKGRITSDNYSIILHITSLAVDKKIDLTEKYGITSFEWESKDEIKTWIPCTRLEPVCIIFQNGFDLTFGSKKENMDDLMDLLLTQHRTFYGNVEKNVTLKEANGSFGKKPTRVLSISRTEKSDPLAGITTSLEGIKQTVNKENKNPDAEGASMFAHDNNPHYIHPEYNLEIKMRHHVLDDNGNNLTESFLFKAVTLYKPSQKTSENSSHIEEGFKGFAAGIELLQGNKKDSTFTQLLYDMIAFQIQPNPPVEKLPYLHRKIINPDNLDLFTS